MSHSETQQLAQVSRHGVLAEAFEILASGAGPFIDERMALYFVDEPSWADAAANRLGRPADHGATDPFFQLLVMRRFWGPVFADYFGEDLRQIISLLIDTRNRWAHFNLPDDTKSLERSILSIERLLAPIQPEATRRLRQLRGLLETSVDPNRGGTDTAGATPNPGVDVVELEAQLSETEAVFQDLQDKYGDLQSALDNSKLVAANKQLRLATLGQQLVEIEGRSLAAEAFLAEERYTRNRIEWLFVGLLATLLLFMILANG